MNSSLHLLQLRAYGLERAANLHLSNLYKWGMSKDHIKVEVDALDLPDGGDPQDPANNVHLVFHLDFGMRRPLVLRGYKEGSLLFEGFEVDDPAGLLDCVREAMADEAVEERPAPDVSDPVVLARALDDPNVVVEEQRASRWEATLVRTIEGFSWGMADGKTYRIRRVNDQSTEENT